MDELEMIKPTVDFTEDTKFGVFFIEVGKRAYVRALNHYRLGLCDAHTSEVLKINEDGSFETLNTIYKPFKGVSNW